MPLISVGCADHSLSVPKRHRKGLRRLLAWFEGLREGDKGAVTNCCVGADEIRRCGRTVRHWRKLMRASSAGGGLPSSEKPAKARRWWRRHGGASECAGPNAEVSTSTDSGCDCCISPDEQWSETECSKATDVDKTGVINGVGGGGSRVMRKRLVIAMETDADEDKGAQPGGINDGSSCASEIIRLRTIMDKCQFRLILQQLCQASDDQVRDFTTVLQKVCEPAFGDICSNVTSPAATIGRNTQGSQTEAVQLTPDTGFNWQSSATAAEDESSEHGTQQLEISLLCQTQSPANQLNQPQGYGVTNFPQRCALEIAVCGPGRRGYRLYHRVFSTQRNYYSVPLPPLEMIKLSRDDDKWEDLEIRVASHKGMEAINPKASHVGRQRLKIVRKKSMSYRAAFSSKTRNTRRQSAARRPQYLDCPTELLPQQKLQHSQGIIKRKRSKRHVSLSTLATPMEVTKIQFGYVSRRQNRHQQIRAGSTHPGDVQSQARSAPRKVRSHRPNTWTVCS